MGVGNVNYLKIVHPSTSTTLYSAFGCSFVCNAENYRIANVTFLNVMRVGTLNVDYIAAGIWNTSLLTSPLVSSDVILAQDINHLAIQSVTFNFSTNFNFTLGQTYIVALYVLNGSNWGAVNYLNMYYTSAGNPFKDGYFFRNNAWGPVWSAGDFGFNVYGLFNDAPIVSSGEYTEEDLVAWVLIFGTITALIGAVLTWILKK